MFTWIMHRGPGTKTTRLAIVVSILAAIFLFLMLVVYPYITPILFPPSSNTV